MAVADVLAVVGVGVAVTVVVTVVVGAAEAQYCPGGA
jgi:hypothetical protein